jgi:WD40 repeat protein/tRNA A-37 threonylcarbamoyl transferase component Bud32
MATSPRQITTDICPDPETLRLLLLGKLSAPELDKLGEHLLHCDQCATKAGTVSAEDVFTEALRSPDPIGEEDREVLAQAIQRAYALRSHAETMETTETITLDPGKSQAAAHSQPADLAPQPPAELIDFLHPPQQPDEIGRLGGYRILEVMGVGGMGVVFKAEDPKLQRLVALKAMKPAIAASQTAKQRFLREAQATAAIEHHHIVQIYQVGEDGGVPFIAMQFLRGEPLQKRLAREGRLPQRDVLRIGREVAAGLQAAHEHGLIHRDIKPDNIWLDAKTGWAKILDFGLVRAVADDADLTHSGMVLGTPRYMAPEQAQGQPLDHRGDLFSLGSVLYHLALGRPAFEGGNLTAVLIAVAQANPPDIAALAADLDPELARLIMRLLSKDPGQRPPSAAEVADAIARIERRLDAAPAGHEPTATVERIVAPPPPQAKPHGGNGRKLTGRQIAVAAGGLAAALLLGVIIITITNKDGTKTTIRVPEGVETQVDAAPGSKVAIVQENDVRRPAETGQPAAGTAGVKPPSSPAAPLVALDLTPPEPLGKWAMGPEPPWFQEGGATISCSLKEGDVLPGIVERPAKLPCLRRWNVDTVWPRGGINVVRWSPDGKWIAAAADDGHVRIYDAATFELRQILPGVAYHAGVRDLSWHPDSQRLAVTADNLSAFRILTLAGMVLSESLEGGPFSAAAWNHAGTQLAVGFYEAGAIELRTADGQLVRRIETGAFGLQPGHLAWATDDKSLAVWHNDWKLRLWNVETGTADVIDEVGNAGHPGHRLEWSKEDWLAVAASQEVRLYGPDRKLASKFPNDADNAAWHPDGKRLLCSGFKVTVWDRDTATELARAGGRAGCAAWRPDGEMCVAGSRERSALRLFRSDLRTLVKATPIGAQSFFAISWSPDGQQLASGCGSFGPLRLWDVNGSQLRCWTEPVTSTADWFAWRPDGGELLAGTEGRVWAAEASGTPRKIFQSNKLVRDGSIALSPDGRFTVVGLTDGHVQVLDQNGEPVAKMSTGGSARAIVAWNHAINRIAVAESGQPLMFCDPANGWTLRQASEKPLGPWTDSPVWSPDGRLLSFRGNNGWYDAEGKQVADTSRPPALAWRPDGQRYLAAFSGISVCEISVCNSDGAIIGSRTTNGHVDCASWHPRGHLFATGTEQSTITAWREADLQPHWHAVSLPEGKAATFSGAGELLSGQPEEIDQYLVYYVEREPGQIETLTPAEFRKLLPPELKAN